MTEPASLKPHPSVVFTRLDENQAALLHLETKQYFSLNETGVLIWQHLERGSNPEAIANDLVARYVVELDAAHTRVEAFLDELTREGLVQGS